MAVSKLGRLEEVSIREVWQLEDADFTPWLADYLDLLGEALREHRTVIKEALGGVKIIWDRKDNQRFSSVNIGSERSIDDSKEKLAEIQDWMLAWPPKLKDALNPRLQEITGKLQSPPEKEPGE